ncbi:MAG: OFA family MFS transporter [Gammaproteobacteria bacterium]|nr:OFA family MFS transporter [Gammaproteobacteria bacterium]MDE1886657.1 OFA family MFS transporter [Gammaproteobacteria bacterium]MDE2023007.1 OFA family MFS transporter [Gammaproteobacteria bacterium]MDE2138959.1 OFA family MFS transporter [Gammaproteobacteria bacterium]MDE2273267.1 OFA family MFS transporter [Gammaproteobacteria bacterium]
MQNRWWIAAGGVLMQLALGAVYAWSVFVKPLAASYGWSIAQITLTFSIAILVLGFGCFFGGLWMNRKGPRIVGVVAGIFYGAGVFLASMSAHHLGVLYLSYGLLGGLGVGLGYIVPVATLVKWFPDKRGMITGIAVAGFGAGALITAPVAAWLIKDVGVMETFAILGIAYLIMVVVGALVMRNPPAGWAPEGWSPSARVQSQRSTREYLFKESLRTWQWYALWGILFLNVVAGISIISQAAPMVQQLTGVTALVAAGMVGIISIANGFGRLAWAWLSDAIGRRNVFITMYLLQVVIFFAIPYAHVFVIFTTLAFIVLLCYGGGFGTMPAFATDYFGSKNIGPIYGLMLTAWGFGGVLGPMLTAFLRESTGGYAQALHIIAVILLVATLIPLIIRPPATSR